MLSRPPMVGAPAHTGYCDCGTKDEFNLRWGARIATEELKHGGASCATSAVVPHSLSPIRITVGLLLLWAEVALADSIALKNERCLRKMSATIAGLNPGYGIPAPTADVPAYADVLLATPAFAERFAGWINSKFNRTPSLRSDENAAHFMALHVVSKGLKWREMFVGRWNIVSSDGNGAYPKVVPDPDGLGYFRSPGWMRRYAGNEADGYRLTAAYRMMQNVVGLHLVASANNAVGNSNAVGRERPECRSCHYDSPFALDKVARVLSRRLVNAGQNDGITFGPPLDGPQMIFKAVSVKDDADVVNAMVNSDQFRFQSCRLAFEYLYGRSENACEALIFDRCMAAFAVDGKIQSAIASVAKDQSFCP